MITKHTWDGVPVITLENEYIAVTICPSLGNNLYRMRDKVRQRDVLRAPERPEQLTQSPVAYALSAPCDWCGRHSCLAVCIIRFWCCRHA
jgi:hypothetical protein